VRATKTIEKEQERIRNNFFLVCSYIEREEGSNFVVEGEGRCSVCGCAAGEKVLVGRFKDKKYFSVKFAPVRVRLVWHSVSGGEKVLMCQKCHTYFHCFTLLSNEARLEWTIFCFYEKI
jgi:hypothetical protein